ncbi:MAG: phosphoenolpyruvate--protein phosphotransferase, partial [Bacteroidetes bacterium]
MPEKKPINLTDHDFESGGEWSVEGVGVAPGIAIGPAYLYARISFDIQKRQLSLDELADEPDRFEKAISRAERDLGKIIDVTREKLGENSAVIFEAQLLMLRDVEMYPAIVTYINEHQINAGYAVHHVMSKHQRLLEASESEYLRERSNDVQDVQDRIIRHLRRGRIISAIDPETIVIAESLTAADMVLFSRRGILGCATDYGGPTSHVSIMARALSVPSVIGIPTVTNRIQNGDTVILDGIRGVLIVNPERKTLERYIKRQARYRRLIQEEKKLVSLPTQTLDGHRISLEANLELREEISQLKEYGAEGIGLFRTEILLLMEGRISISEDEQFAVYERVVAAAAPGHTTFRVLDLGGDKLLPMAHREHNPFLGWRGIRVLLDRPEIMVPQLRAILRASAGGNTRILLPMITNLDEVHRFKIVLAEIMEKLSSEKIEYDADIPVGIMVEVPAVALMAEQFSREVDFFSIGTNDLTQFVLAVDRGNDLVAGMYKDLHPDVLILIHNTIAAAKSAGIPVSLCGELATNLRAVPVLVGLGIEALSASPVYLPS